MLIFDGGDGLCRGHDMATWVSTAVKVRAPSSNNLVDLVLKAGRC